MLTTAATGPRPRVLLVRDMPEQRLRSRERLADGIERAFAAHPSYAVVPFALHASPVARLRPLARLDSYATRFVRYPLALHRVARRPAAATAKPAPSTGTRGASAPPDAPPLSKWPVPAIRRRRRTL